MRAARGLDRLAQVGGRVGGELLQARRGRAGGRRRRPRSAARGPASRSASSRRATARYCARPSWTSAASWRRSRSIAARQQLAPQPGGRDAGRELQPEQAQDGPAQRVDPDRLGGAGDDDAHHLPFARDQRQDHPVGRGWRERVLDQPRRGLAQHDRRAGGDGQPPRLLVEGELLGARRRRRSGAGRAGRRRRGGRARRRAGAAPRASPPARRAPAPAARRCRRAPATRARPRRARSRTSGAITARYYAGARDHRRRPPADARGHRGAAGRGPADRRGRARLRRARGGRAGGAAEARRRAAGCRDAGHRRGRGVRGDPRAASRACGC